MENKSSKQASNVKQSMVVHLTKKKSIVENYSIDPNPSTQPDRKSKISFVS